MKKQIISLGLTKQKLQVKALHTIKGGSSQRGGEENEMVVERIEKG